MIALFDEPLRVTLNSDLYPVGSSSPVGLLLGFVIEPATTKQARQCSGLVVLPDGSTDLIPNYAFTIDWRYKVERDRFVDLETEQTQGEEEQEP